MKDPRIGLGLVVLGVILVVVGLVVRSGEGADSSAVASTRTVAATTPPVTADTPSTTLAATTTTSAPTTTTPTTTTDVTTTTTAATTTTTAPDELIRAFIAQYAAATDSDDAEFLYSTMHPTVIAAGGEELCRTFVEAEIVLISEYQLIGPITGPVQLVGNVEAYQAEVSFSFQGQQFTDTAAYAAEDGTVFWFTTCR